MPGVSIRQAPRGSSNSARCVVVWRPRPSLSRVAAVAMRDSPSSVLVSVDLPAPEEPTSTAVAPGVRYGSSAMTLRASLPLIACSGVPAGSRAASCASASWPRFGIQLVQLGQHDHRRGATAFDQREIAFRARGIEIVIQPHQQQHDIHIRGDDLTRVTLAGRGARQGAAPREDLDDMRRRTGLDDDEIAHRGAFVRLDPAFQETRRGLRIESALAVVHFIAGAVLRADTREPLRVAQRRQRATPADARSAE